MAQSDMTLRCPHCGEVLRPFTLPDNTGWDDARQWACFNDECSYFKDGWDWMWAQYEVKASYRYRVVDQNDLKGSPLPVWSATAIRDRIIEEDGN